MKRSLRTAIGLALVSVLMWTGVARAQTTIPQNSAFWTVTYWNNTTLTGNAVLQTNETGLTHQWGSASPAQGTVNADQFSARWTTNIDLPAATYRFTTLSDDGVRLWVDGTLIIDNWNAHSAATNSVNVTIGGGIHSITLEYFDRSGDATIALGWQNISNPNIQNWRAEYFNNTQQTGTPILVRDDAAINFDWGTGSPASGLVATDQFSVRWTRTLTLDPGLYRFKLIVDDGGRLTVGGQVIINRYQNQPATTYIADYYHAGGALSVQLDYYDNADKAVAKLTWERTSIAASADDLSLSAASGPVGSTVIARASNFPANATVNISIGNSQTNYTFVRTAVVSGTGTLEASVTVPSTAISGQPIYVVALMPDNTLKRVSPAFTVTGTSAPAPAPAPGLPDGAIIIDQDDTGVLYGGVTSEWSDKSGGHDGTVRFTRNSLNKLGSYEWARWYLTLNAGTYEVYVYIPAASGLTKSAPYWVHHLGGYKKVTVDQSANQGKWVSLGKYRFDNRRNMRLFVSLSDVTGETFHTTDVAFDAVAVVKR